MHTDCFSISVSKLTLSATVTEPLWIWLIFVLHFSIESAMLSLFLPFISVPSMIQQRCSQYETPVCASMFCIFIEDIHLLCLKSINDNSNIHQIHRSTRLIQCWIILSIDFSNWKKEEETKRGWLSNGPSDSTRHEDHHWHSVELSWIFTHKYCKRSN